MIPSVYIVLTPCHFYVHWKCQIKYDIFPPADLPTCEISTKRIKVAEEEEEEKTLDKGEEGNSIEEKVWPEPPKRVTPTIRTAVVLPDGVTCPDGCKRFSSSEDLDPLIISKLK